MSAIAAKPTFAHFSILALLVLGCAQVTSQVTGDKNRVSGVRPPACGRVTPRQTPLGTNGDEPDVRDFPWHANIYAEGFPSGGTEKSYRCGATIIRPNLLVTAGQCVALSPSDSEKLFVMTGNLHREWDSPHNTAASVRKSAVKNLYVHCQHFGILTRLANDIALIELEEPLPLSESLTPACFDVAGYSEQLLVPGAYGKLAEFEAHGPSDILKMSTLPYVSSDQCRLDVIDNDRRNSDLFTNDKFCAGYANGMAAPQSSAGGGLVFEKDNAWYLMGIHSSTLFFNEADDRYSEERLYYSLHTNISDFTGWIQGIMSFLDRNESVPPCDRSNINPQELMFSSFYDYQ